MAVLLSAATHVERTDDPAVLRWVCHRDDLADSPDGPRVAPAGSPLGELVADGRLAGVSLAGGDLLVRVAAGVEWPELVAEVHERVAAELGAESAWLLDVPDGQVVELRARAASLDDPDGCDAPDAPDAGAAPACGGCHVRSSCGSAHGDGRRARRWSLRRAG
jgi:hypothetical protein